MRTYYQKNPGDCNPCPVYMDMDEDGNIDCDTGPSGNGVPMSVWNGRTLRWNISPYARPEVVEDFINENRERFTEIHNDHDIVWDGRNRVGRLTDEARDESEKIQFELDELFSDESSLIIVMDASDWIGDGFWDVWKADKTLEEAAKDAEEIAEMEGVLIDGDLEKTLLRIAENRLHKGEKLYPIHIQTLKEQGIIDDEDEE